MASTPANRVLCEPIGQMVQHRAPTPLHPPAKRLILPCTLGTPCSLPLARFLCRSPHRPRLSGLFMCCWPPGPTSKSEIAHAILIWIEHFLKATEAQAEGCFLSEAQEKPAESLVKADASISLWNHSSLSLLSDLLSCFVWRQCLTVQPWLAWNLLTCYIDQAGLELRDIRTSASCVLGLNQGLSL